MFDNQPQISLPRLLLILPDNTKVTLSEPTCAHEPTEIAVASKAVCVYRPLDRVESLVVSSIGTPYEQAAQHVPKYAVVELSSPYADVEEGSEITIPDFWAVVYALFTLHHEQEVIPLLISSSIKNNTAVQEYLLRSGLGRIHHAPGASQSNSIADVFLLRTTFWQGAGTHGFHSRGWLPSSSTSTTNAYASFPHIQSFTRTSLVITSNPLRPPKPRQGETLYRRHCPGVTQTLEFVYFNLDNDEAHKESGVSLHLQAFNKWHNDPRVSKWWGEQGSLEDHRQYLRNLMADPAVLPIIMSWDGELMGYAEICWLKENHVAQYMVDGARNWDRGNHVLVGEDKFRGSARVQAWLRSLNHYCFLADPRTDRVIMEPRADNVAIMKVTANAHMQVEKLFDFPYKRSALLSISRERMFTMDML